MTDTNCQFCHVAHKPGAVPTVHLNGTSGKSLSEQLQAAVEALTQARHAVFQASPNGRDYYPQGGQAMHLAMDAHERRCKDLNRVIEELTEMRDHVEMVVEFQQAAKAEAARSEPHVVSAPSNEQWCEKCNRPLSLHDGGLCPGTAA